MENSIWRFLKKNIELPYDLAVLLLGIYISQEKTIIQKYTYISVYCSIFYNSQDMETTKMSIDGGMDKEVVLIHSRMLFSHKKNAIMPFEVTWME